MQIRGNISLDAARLPRCHDTAPRCNPVLFRMRLIRVCKRSDRSGLSHGCSLSSRIDRSRKFESGLACSKDGALRSQNGFDFLGLRRDCNQRPRGWWGASRIHFGYKCNGGTADWNRSVTVCAYREYLRPLPDLRRSPFSRFPMPRGFVGGGLFFPHPITFQSALTSPRS